MVVVACLYPATVPVELLTCVSRSTGPHRGWRGGTGGAKHGGGLDAGDGRRSHVRREGPWLALPRQRACYGFPAVDPHLLARLPRGPPGDARQGAVVGLVYPAGRGPVDTVRRSAARDGRDVGVGRHWPADVVEGEALALLFLLSSRISLSRNFCPLLPTARIPRCALKRGPSSRPRSSSPAHCGTRWKGRLGRSGHTGAPFSKPSR